MGWLPLQYIQDINEKLWGCFSVVARWTGVCLRRDLAAVLCYKSREKRKNLSKPGAAAVRRQLLLKFGGVKTQAMEYVIAAIVGVACLLIGMLLG